MNWRPIETAPKDGDPLRDSPMLLLYKQGHPDDYAASVCIGFWCDGGAFGDNEGFWADWGAGLVAVYNGHEEWVEINPTHWMPLPPPPESKD